MLHVLYYNKYEKKYELNDGKQTHLIENIVLHNVTFFIAPQAIDIIRDRAKNISKFEAKFPHAFAISKEKDSLDFYKNNMDLNWKDFNYDVFTNDFFVLSDNNMSLQYKEIEHLMVSTDNEGKMLRKLVIKK